MLKELTLVLMIPGGLVAGIFPALAQSSGT
jgi:hypothetical protein